MMNTRMFKKKNFKIFVFSIFYVEKIIFMN